MNKFLKFLVLFIVIIVLGGFIFLRNFSHKPLFDYNKDIKINNLQADVDVYRDENGIPTIVAQNELDLYRVAGYVTAEDRLWQMDLIRRATQGRLSEIFGKDLVHTDLLLRALQISEKSQMIYDSLSPELKQVLIAYADGVNQFIEQNKNKLPIEFKILGYKPDAWAPQNSLNLIGYIAWDLAMAWGNEIILYELSAKVDSALWTSFVPDFSDDEVIYRLSQYSDFQLDTVFEGLGKTLENLGIVPFTASNNWAVSGTRTKSGKPILCNDMHLGYGIPGIWYQLHLIVKDKLNVTGVSLPGAPGIISGHNDSIAWGMTNVMLDGSDFYIETLNDDSTKYLLDGEWKDLIVKNQKIATKEGDTIILPLKFTHRGPIISEFKHLNKAVSMCWIGYKFSNELKGIYLLNHANNWQDFLQACKEFGAVSQNIVYADYQGNIGIKLTGLIPKRQTAGYFIFPGDTSLYDWQGFVPFDSLPVEYNPACGYVASANNKSSSNVDFYISQYFYRDYRYKRIADLLSVNDTIDVNYMAKVQTDQHSILADEIMPEFLDFFTQNSVNVPEYQSIITEMQTWNNVLSAQSVAALFFEQFNILFVKNSVADELGNELYQKFDNSKILMNNIIAILWQQEQPKLYDNINTESIENYADIMILTFKQTIDTLKSQLGDNVNDWQYGRLHTLTLKHPLSKVKILNFVFNLNRGSYGVGGSNHTISPYSYPYDAAFKVTHGASQRHIFDFANFDNSLTIMPTGESGVPASPFYCDQTERYVGDKYHKDLFSLQSVIDNAKFKMKFLSVSE